MNETVPQIAYLNKPRGWSFQISIRGLMILTALIGLIAGAIAVPPVFAVLSVVAFLLISPFLLTLAIFGRGWIRPFAIGGLVPHVVTYLLCYAAMRSPESVLVTFAISIGATIAFGLVTACGYGWLRRSGGLVEIPNIPFIRNWLTNE